MNKKPWFDTARVQVYLREPRLEDRRIFLQSVKKSREFHYPWVFPPASNAAFKTYLGRLEQPSEAGHLIIRQDDDALLGVVNLSVITYQALCSAYTGYYAFTGYQDYGYMKQGLMLVINQAFGELGLHRLEANIQPGNLASIELVRGLGFQCEGFSPRYLKIYGEWRDHERWALLAD